MDTGRKLLAEVIGTFFLCFAGIAAILSTQSPIDSGAGLIGLMAIPVARAAGAAAVYASDVNPNRLEMARTLGVDVAIDVARESVPERTLELTEGRGVDVVLEMSGNPAAISDGLRALRPGGDVAVLGLPSGSVELDWANLVVLKGATVRGIYGRKIWDTWHRMRGLLESGAVDLRPLITHEFALEDFERGFDAMRSGEGGKVILRPPPQSATNGGGTP